MAQSPTPKAAPAAAPAPTAKAAETELLSLRTSGAFVLMDPWSGKHFSNDAATETPLTPFVENRMASGELVKA